MVRRLTHEELLAKVGWKGGVLEAVSWGIGSNEVPKEIEYQWSEVVILHRQLDELINDIYDILEERAEEGAGDE